MAVEVPIRLVATGGKASADEVGRVEAAIAASRRELDAFAKGGGLGALAVGRRELDLASKDITTLGNEARAAQVRIGQLNAELADSGRTRPLQVVINDLEQAERSAAELENRLSRVTSELREGTAQSVGFLGDIDSSLQAIGGAGRTLGDVTGIEAFSQVGEGFTVVGDLFAVAEALPRLSSAANELQSRLGAAVQAARAASAAQALENTTDLASVGTTGAATTAEGTLTGARLASAKATGLAVASSLAIPAAIGAVVLAYNQLQTAQEQAAAPVDAYIASFENLKTSQLDGVDVNELSSTELTQLLAAERERVAQIREATEQTRRLNEESRKAIDEFSLGNLAEELPFIGDVIERTGINELIDDVIALADETRFTNPFSGVISFTNDLFQTGRDVVASDAQGSIAGFVNELIVLEAQAQQNIGVIEQQVDVALRQEEQERTLIRARQEEARVIRDSVDQLDDLTRQRDASRARIDSLRESQAEARARRADTLAQRERQRVFDADQERRRNALTARIEEAQQVEEARKARAEIIEIQNEARQQESAIRQRAAQEQVQARAKLNNDIAKVNEDFQREQIAAVQQFRKDELRRQEDYNRERLRLIDDLDRSLLDAARDNDVNAFIAAQERGLTNLARNAEDQDVETRRRGEDFTQARQGAVSERSQRIADLQAEFAAAQAERQRAAQQEIQNIRQQAQERAAAIRQGTEQTLTEVDRLQQQLVELEKTFIQEREQFRLEEEVRAYNERQNFYSRQIQQESRNLQQFNAELTARSAIVGKNAAIVLLNSINQQLNQPVAALSASLSGLFGGRGGTVVNNRPITINNTMGDVATTRDVQRSAERVLTMAAQAFQQ